MVIQGLLGQTKATGMFFSLGLVLANFASPLSFATLRFQTRQSRKDPYTY